jgi:uncharacterized protein (TIGR02147 family)
MTIVEFTDYKAFVRALIKTYPKLGRGQARRLAEHLNLPPTVVSQILVNDRHFTPDQAVEVGTFFGLDEKSTEYFIYLVNLARADTKKLQGFYEMKLNKIRSEVQNVKNLVRGRDELSEENTGRYYSNWYYSGIWNLSAIPGFQTVESIANYFGLSRSKVGEVVSFLVESGLSVEEAGKIRPGLKSTHLSDKSAYVNNHRRNWREKAKEKFTDPGERDLFVSIPVSMSESDAEKFRLELLKIIKAFSKLVEPSPEEQLMCLNIDWFAF